MTRDLQRLRSAKEELCYLIEQIAQAVERRDAATVRAMSARLAVVRDQIDRVSLNLGEGALRMEVPRMQ